MKWKWRKELEECNKNREYDNTIKIRGKKMKFEFFSGPWPVSERETNSEYESVHKE